MNFDCSSYLTGWCPKSSLIGWNNWWSSFVGVVSERWSRNNGSKVCAVHVWEVYYFCYGAGFPFLVLTCLFWLSFSIVLPLQEGGGRLNFSSLNMMFLLQEYEHKIAFLLTFFCLLGKWVHALSSQHKKHAKVVWCYVRMLPSICRHAETREWLSSLPHELRSSRALNNKSCFLSLLCP